jgi:hypothetical protein
MAYSGSWDEVRGTRNEDTSSVSFTDWIITFQAATGTALPAKGTLHGAWQKSGGGGTELSATGLIAAPEAVQIGARTRFTENLDRVTVRFRGFDAE